VAVIALVLALVRGWPTLVAIELGIAVAVLGALLALRALGHRPARDGAAAALPGTLALSVARALRTCPVLQAIHAWVFGWAVPIVFALGLVAAGVVLANRALFDGASAAGAFCPRGLGTDAQTREKVGTADGFTTDALCWPSGLVVEAGRRYRITLTTPGDWFDRTLRADVAGFAAENPRLVLATPMKRWWGEPWFRPIARIGRIGNDEYALAPAEPFEPYTYPACPEIIRATGGSGVRAKVDDGVARRLLACAPTPSGRTVLTAEITARTTGELYLYVNDAVLAWPGATDLFVANNTGRASVEVKRITAAR
jgi:hypothetical protein